MLSRAYGGENTIKRKAVICLANQRVRLLGEQGLATKDMAAVAIPETGKDHAALPL